MHFDCKCSQWLIDRPIAHRGLHQNCSIPENSIAAFEAAIAQNYPIELDVQLIADGELAVFHDVALHRLTGAQGSIFEQTLASLKSLRLLGTDETIPSLGQVLHFVDGRVPLLIELKNEGAAGKPEAALLSQVSGYQGLFAIQSFNPCSLQWFQHNAPHILRGQLAGNFKGVPLAWYKKQLLSNLLLNWASRPHFIAYDVRALPNLPTLLSHRIFNLPLLAWTIRSDRDRQWALKYADNFIFDVF
ncbi:MAG TPA: glycerophosphodiester phosphodiesterase [Leptolyngbyaceae cyanobacterium M33_DOE_097]|uniref:Glycerophosphodiester phosphodiesterase n=1 Tax=Oscillatoriales cyanobacterium SpSt-418 TaxID=2282169 RepID=A0A7C3PJT7_9CYAN|nr:glycerophosphodiester phosphodiesterase [Leptolyngbyaceae cyanobacterium M33_DOE_097]